MIDLGDDFFWPSTSPLLPAVTRSVSASLDELRKIGFSGEMSSRCLRLRRFVLSVSTCTIQVNLVVWGDDLVVQWIHAHASVYGGVDFTRFFPRESGPRIARLMPSAVHT